jgi:hypothetical protein
MVDQAVTQILLAIAFWWWRGHTQSQQVVFGSTLKIHYEPAMAGDGEQDNHRQRRQPGPAPRFT